MELTQPKDLQDCLEKAGSSSEKSIEDCLHVSNEQFTQIKKMAKCLDGDFKTIEELQTKVTECLGEAYLHILNCNLIVLLFYFDTRVSPIKLFKL